jgi:hypothetical protein
MGINCLLAARVKGYKRVPEPPAKIIPFVMKSLFSFSLYL